MTSDMWRTGGASLQWLRCQAGQCRDTQLPLPARSSQTGEDVSLVPAAQGFPSHKHSHTSRPLLGTSLGEVQVPRAPRLCPRSHGQPPAFAGPYVPWLMLCPAWHALLSLCPGPTIHVSLRHCPLYRALPASRWQLFLLSRLCTEQFPPGVLPVIPVPLTCTGPISLSLFPVPSLGLG